MTDFFGDQSLATNANADLVRSECSRMMMRLDENDVSVKFAIHAFLLDSGELVCGTYRNITVTNGISHTLVKTIIEILERTAVPEEEEISRTITLQTLRVLNEKLAISAASPGGSIYS